MARGTASPRTAAAADTAVQASSASPGRSQRRRRGRRDAAGHRSGRGLAGAAAERGAAPPALAEACPAPLAAPPPLLTADDSIRGGGRAGSGAHPARQWRGQAWLNGPAAPPGFSFACPGSGVPLARPPPPPLFVNVRLPPWCRSGTPTAYPLSEDGLTHELVDFFHYLELNQEEAAARSRLLGRVQAAVRELWATTSEAARVVLYGSYALGLSLPASDIDLVLTFPAEEQLDDVVGEPSPAAAKRRQHLHLERLHDLAERLRRTQGCPPLQVDVYDQCRVPRVHLRDPAHGGISCDINSSITSARVACTVARQRLWLREAPLAAFLVRLTKAAVKQWGLNEVFCGGVASTALYCLVLRFLAQLEQLHRHDAVTEANWSPPRYDDVATAAASAPSPVSASPARSRAASPRGSPVAREPAELEAGTVTPSTGAAAPPTAAMTMSAAAARAPAYVPSWALTSTKYGLSKSSSLAEVDGQDDAARRDGAGSAEGDRTRCASISACSLAHWDSAKAAAAPGAGDDDEVDRYTQAGLTHSSGATTAATTPVSRTAASTPPPPSSSSSSASVHETASGAVPGPAPCLTAEELTRVAQARYGASPARLLLKLWTFLSSDVFLNGYQVADVFGDDAVWADCGELDHAAGAAPAQMPSASSLELATFASAPSADLSAASFRIPDLLALFRCTSASLENMLRFQRYPRRDSPTMLSTIFVDPRIPTCCAP